MKLVELKSEFHTLIDRIDDPEIIELFYDAMVQSTKPEGSIWATLTEEQQHAVLEAYDESEDEKNLVPFSKIKERFQKWDLK